MQPTIKRSSSKRVNPSAVLVAEPAQPRIVSLGYARVWTERAPKQPAADTAAISDLQQQLDAASARVGNLVAAVAQAPSPNLLAELNRSEAAVTALQSQLADLHRVPPPRSNLAQAVCLVTSGNSVEQLLPIEAPTESFIYARAALERTVSRFMLLRLDALELVSDLAARQHTQPLEMGTIIAAGLSVDGAPTAHRLVVRDGQVLESVQLGGNDSRAAAHGQFKAALDGLRAAALHDDRLLFLSPARTCGGHLR